MTKLVTIIITVVTLGLYFGVSKAPRQPAPTRTLAPLWTATAVTLPTETPEPVQLRNCNPDTGWWDMPVLPEYAIAIVIDHETHGYDYCPPPGSEWERWANTPGYFQTPPPLPPATPTVPPYPLGSLPGSAYRNEIQPPRP